MKKNAVVLFNLGGPDSLKAVRPFLLNLFNDRSIINLPQPLRFIVALLLSTSRVAKARAMYQHMGGKSPILEFTMAQAESLEKKLNAQSKDSQEEYKVFVCMRYWHPMSRVVVKKVKVYEPDHITLLPLYPQYSTTTTASSFRDWEDSSRKEGLNVQTSRICCYPADRSFVASHVKLIRDMYWKAAEEGKPRLLFSAHALPESIVAAGDPYPWQVEKTVESIIQILSIDNIDYRICYQSRVGPMQWIGPSIREEIVHAGKDKVPVVIIPITFVSEHSETLMELDVDYRKVAEQEGVQGYYRVPALGTEPLFIEALADLCINNSNKTQICSFNKTRHCPTEISKCPCPVS